MIVQRSIFGVAALAARAAAAAIIVFAAAFALYALLRDILTPAGAAGAVCLAAAILAGIVCLVAASMARGPKLKPGRVRGEPYRAPPSMIERVVNVAKERPFVAAGAAVAAGLLAIANPAIVTAVMRAFFDPTRPPRR